MKKITLIVGLLIFSIHAYAQCVNTILFPNAEFIAVNDGNLQTISTVSWAGDYSLLTGLLLGNPYEFAITLNSDTTHGYVTIVDNADSVTVLAHGPSPLTWSSTTIDEVQLHWNSDNSCTSDTVNHTTTYQMLLPCINTSQFPPGDLVAVSDGSLQTISTVHYSGEYSVLTGLFIETPYEFSVTLNSDTSHGYVTIVDNTDGVTVLAHGPSPLTWSPTLVDNVQLHWNNDASCAADTENHTTTYRLLTMPCTNTFQYPPTDLVAVNDGSEQIIAIDSYAGDYTVLTGLNIGDTYQFDITLNSDSSHGYVTIIDNADGFTRLDYGMSPFIWTATTTDIQLHWNNDNGCTSDTEDHTTTYIDLIPPENDTCLTAIPINCGETITGDTTFATDTIGSGIKDVWYSFTGSGMPQFVTLNLCNNTNFDTYMYVIDSCDLETTVLIVADDNGCGITPGPSQVSFVSNGVSTYYIGIEGFDVDDFGTFELFVNCLPASADECDFAETLPLAEQRSGFFFTSTTSAGTAPSCLNSAGFIDNWYQFVAPATTKVNVATTLLSETETYVAMYESCDLTTELGCSANPGDQMLEVEGLTPGNTYYVRVWRPFVPDTNMANNQRGGVPTSYRITITEETLGLNNPAEFQFSYYPNPVKNNLVITAKQPIETIRIHNILGQEVMQLHPKTLEPTVSMEHLNSGMYLVSVTIKNTTETFKVIKE